MNAPKNCLNKYCLHLLSTLSTLSAKVCSAVGNVVAGVQLFGIKRVSLFHWITAKTLTGKLWWQVRGCTYTTLHYITLPYFGEFSTKWIFHSSLRSIQFVSTTNFSWLFFFATTLFSRGQPLPHYVVVILLAILPALTYTIPFIIIQSFLFDFFLPFPIPFLLWMLQFLLKLATFRSFFF